MRNLLLAGVCVAAIWGMSDVRARAGDCAGLTKAAFEGAEIASAETTEAGPFEIPAMGPFPSRSVDLPAFCRVKGVAASRIGFEVWLPTAQWNGRLVAVGSGGFGGTIGISDLADKLKQGYAVTANDTGHTGSGIGWMHDANALLDWGHRATHIVSLPAKGIVAAYYGKAAAYSYFQGCSTGGAQAMEEAEFYPADFNGIVAGSPGMDYSHLMLSFLWGLKAATDHAAIPEEKLQILNRSVMAQCDGLDGLADGSIANPQACRADPAALLCKAGQDSACLTPAEAETAALIYQGPRNPKTDAQIYPGFAAGSEASPAFTGKLAPLYGWTLIQGPLATQYAVPLLKNMAFGDGWDWKTFDWDKDVERFEAVVHDKIDATDPDLRAFAEDGGKLIMTQGWGDPFNAQTMPVGYRNAVIAVFARATGQSGATASVDRFFRLFMAPGMGHCGGGPGPSQFDALSAMRRWVEQGEAPERLIATTQLMPGVPPQTALSRPLCPYPKSARYSGNGAPNNAAHFICATPQATDH
jgi:feruloyl esterase